MFQCLFRGYAFSSSCCRLPLSQSHSFRFFYSHSHSKLVVSVFVSICICVRHCIQIQHLLMNTSVKLRTTKINSMSTEIYIESDKRRRVYIIFPPCNLKRAPSEHGNIHIFRIHISRSVRPLYDLSRDVYIRIQSYRFLFWKMLFKQSPNARW